jgi:hypothetical protein
VGKLRLPAEVTFAAPALAAICGVCNLNMTREHGWPATMAVYHCDSRSKHGRSHHHNKATWGDCWKCKRPLGCGKCAARTLEEAFCMHCGVWGSREALLEQGLIVGQTIDQYPAQWREDYLATQSARTQSAVLK